MFGTVSQGMISTTTPRNSGEQSVEMAEALASFSSRKHSILLTWYEGLHIVNNDTSPVDGGYKAMEVILSAKSNCYKV